MSKLNGNGPKDNNTEEGRKLGHCSDLQADELLVKLGKG
jgi:hypothetical protein